MKKPAVNSKALRQGGYLAAVTAAVVALVVLINLVVGAIPAQYTELDVSESRLFELSDTTLELLDGLDQDVTIYYLCETGAEDAEFSEELASALEELLEGLKTD